MCHATESKYASAQLQSIGPYFSGLLAVRTFFVMSGFLITDLLMVEKSKTGKISLPIFYMRRFLRLFPVQFSYVFAIFLATLVTKLQIQPCAFVTALTYTKNYACMAAPDGHFWTLSVEEQFYLLWPLAIILLPRRWLLGVAIGFIAVSPVSRAIEYHGGNHNWWWLTSNSDSVMIGCLMAIFFKEPWLHRIVSYRPTLGRACAAVLIAVPIILNNYLLFGIFTVTIAPTMQDLCLAYLMCSCLLMPRGLTFRLFNTQPFIYLGLASYSLYIWQQIFFYTSFPDYGVGDSFIFHFPANLIFAVAAGLVSYYLIERPMMDVRRVATRSMTRWVRARDAAKRPAGSSDVPAMALGSGSIANSARVE